MEAIRPLMPFTALFVITTTWVLLSRNDICFLEPRLMFLLFGTIFSNICVSCFYLKDQRTQFTSHVRPSIFQCRLIVAQMSDTRTDGWNTFFWPLLVGVAISILPYPSLGMKDIDPAVERWVVYVLTTMLTLAHFHYGQGIVSVFPARNSMVSTNLIFFWINFQVREMCRHFKIKCFKVRENTMNGSINKRN